MRSFTTGSRAARWLVAPAVALVAALAVGTGTAAAALPEPLPGTATSKFLTGWFPYWYGSVGGAAEISRLVAHSGPEGYVGEVMVFTLYSRYRINGIQDPVCVHDGSDVKAVECARTAPTATQAAQAFRAKGLREAGWRPVGVFGAATVVNLLLALGLAALLFQGFEVDAS